MLKLKNIRIQQNPQKNEKKSRKFKEFFIYIAKNEKILEIHICMRKNIMEEKLNEIQSKFQHSEPAT